MKRANACLWFSKIFYRQLIWMWNGFDQTATLWRLLRRWCHVSWLPVRFAVPLLHVTTLAWLSMPFYTASVLIGWSRQGNEKTSFLLYNMSSRRRRRRRGDMAYWPNTLTVTTAGIYSIEHILNKTIMLTANIYKHIYIYLQIIFLLSSFVVFVRLFTEAVFICTWENFDWSVKFYAKNSGNVV